MKRRKSKRIDELLLLYKISRRLKKLSFDIRKKINYDDFYIIEVKTELKDICQEYFELITFIMRINIKVIDDCITVNELRKMKYELPVLKYFLKELSKPLFNEKLIKNQIILSSHLLDLSEDISKVAKKIYAVYEINLNGRRIVIPEISIGFVKQTV